MEASKNIQHYLDHRALSGHMPAEDLKLEGPGVARLSLMVTHVFGKLTAVDNPGAKPGRPS